MTDRRFDAVIFDLDGTLIDSLADIGQAANAMLIELGFPPHPLDAYRLFVGEGVATLVQRCLPPTAQDEATMAAAIECYRAAYARHWNVCTRLYDGVREMLEEMLRRGLRLAVLSNKPQRFTEQCVQEFLGEFPFVAVWGQRDGVPRKPDPTAAKNLLPLLNVTAARTLYLGDSAIDMQTAVGAGLFPLGALWGFRSEDEIRAAGARQVVQHPRDVLAVL